MGKCEIIAEIGWNHMGDMKLAEEMISEAAKSGVDYCKFQTWKIKNLKDGPWNKDGRLEIYKKAELSDENHQSLFKLCQKYKVKFLTSVFNPNDLDLISNISADAVKIPSHEIYNKKLIELACSKFKRIFISVGACKWEEFENILKMNIYLKKIYFMHCVSSYPLSYENVNIPKLLQIKKKHNQFGYSGHSKGIDDAIAAICLGSLVVEKHFTVNNDLPGRDNKFALLPEEMKKISKFRDIFSKMSENKGLDVQECEIDIYKNYRGRWSKN